jgi:hypothetical protein
MLAILIMLYKIIAAIEYGKHTIINKAMEIGKRYQKLPNSSSPQISPSVQIINVIAE